MSEVCRNTQAARVCLIGTFPPSASGQASINESFRRMASDAGATVSIIDLSPRVGVTTLRRRVSRIPRALVGLSRLLATLVQRRIDTVYLGVSGGYGQMYDILFASLVRLSGVRFILHHDSYAYLYKRRWLATALMRIAGPSATHVVGCSDMKERLLEVYGRAYQTALVSNVTNTEQPTIEPRPRTRLKTVGLISHLAQSKGVLEFLAVAERLCAAHPDVRILLAGTIQELSLAAVIEQYTRASPSITYLGPVYGAQKSNLYSEMDAFLFPTRHADEADPKVVYEALAHGVPIVARSRGCIESLVRDGGGTVIHEGVDFVNEAVTVLTQWYEDPVLFSSISSAALANSARLQADHNVRLTALIAELASPHGAARSQAPVNRG